MRERFITVLGLRLRVLVGGEGPPALLLHGVGESAEDWGPVAPALGRNRTLYALDLPGHGRSDAPLPPFDPDRSTPLLLGVLDALGIASADIVGNSAGGHKAVCLALDAPERVRSLTLVSPVGFGRGANPIYGALVAPLLGEWGILWARLPFGPWLRAANRAPLLCTRPALIPDEWWQAQVGMGMRFGTLEAALTELRYYLDITGQQRRPLLDRARHLRQPALILWGDRDQTLPVHEAYAAQATIPDSRLRILPGAGHVPMLDDADRVAEAVLGFWREFDARSARAA